MQDTAIKATHAAAMQVASCTRQFGFLRQRLLRPPSGQADQIHTWPHLDVVDCSDDAAGLLKQLLSTATVLPTASFRRLTLTARNVHACSIKLVVAICSDSV
jgi:hypothetical protein